MKFRKNIPEVKDDRSYQSFGKAVEVSTRSRDVIRSPRLPFGHRAFRFHSLCHYDPPLGTVNASSALLDTGQTSSL